MMSLLASNTLLARLALALVPIGVLPLDPGSVPAPSLYTEGQQAYSSGDYAKALRLLSLYVERNAEGLTGHQDFAGKLKDAIADCESKITEAFRDQLAYQKLQEEKRSSGKVAMAQFSLSYAVALPGAEPEAGPNTPSVAEHLGRFGGEYEGFDDGRAARLTIDVDQPNQAEGRATTFRLRFVDLERKAEFTGSVHPRPGGVAHAHIVRDVVLRQRGGNATKTFSLLLLHTLDPDHLTAVTSWNGRAFGASFERVASGVRHGTLEIRQTWSGDLDAGLQTDSASRADADVFFHAVTASERYLEPISGALLADLKGARPSRETCAAALRNARVPRVDVQNLARGAWWAVSTNKEQLGALRLIDAGTLGSGLMRLEYMLWPSQGQR